MIGFIVIVEIVFIVIVDVELCSSYILQKCCGHNAVHSTQKLLMLLLGTLRSLHSQIRMKESRNVEDSGLFLQRKEMNNTFSAQGAGNGGG